MRCGRQGGQGKWCLGDPTSQVSEETNQADCQGKKSEQCKGPETLYF